MKNKFWNLVTVFLCGLALLTSCQQKTIKSVTIPMILDHNRMLVEAEFQRKDGTWRKAMLWVDTGNPDFIISEPFARDLGIVITEPNEQEIPSPAAVRIGGMPISFDGVKSKVFIEGKWMFNTMHNDGNLPSTVLQKYHIVFDYPALQFTIAEQGILNPRGTRSPAIINPVNGILQMDAIVDGENYSFALDNGASFSFVPEDIVIKLIQRHPEWPNNHGATGCANIWGWWAEEDYWPMVRIPEIKWGTLNISGVALVGLPPIFKGGIDLGTRYSQKTARPVNGFLGPNAFKTYRIEIDYQDNAVYFENGAEPDMHDMDIVPLTLRPLDDKSYMVIGVAIGEGQMLIEGIEPGDILIQVDNFKTKGETMGKVVDVLRGKPGDLRKLILERDGKQFTIETRVVRFLGDIKLSVQSAEKINSNAGRVVAHEDSFGELGKSSGIGQVAELLN